MATTIAVIGAGLTGLMCAIHLAHRGFKVIIFEKRQLSDIRAAKYKSFGLPGRSMSMDISARGIYALKNVGLYDKILSNSVPMKYKIIHDYYHRQTVLPYGQFENEHILAVSRTYLFQTLLDKCQNIPNIRINFGHQLLDIDVNKKIIRVQNGNTQKTINPNIVLGADGINSAVRNILQKNQDYAFLISDFPMSYKELSIPNQGRNFRLDAMHIWPRIDMMLVAQPNIDHSFTCSLLMHEQSNNYSFSNITTPKAVRELFSIHFSDASLAMPQLELEYMTNPIGKIKIISGPIWTYQDFILLMGDAAHGMTPFFGQGVNCCFEDCTFLMKHLEETNNDWVEVFHRFDQIRVPEAHAINKLSYENYPELFAQSNLARLTLIKELENFLAKHYQDIYRSYHNLVCFDRISYTIAEKVKKLQVPILERLSSDINDIKQLDQTLVQKEMLAYQKNLSSLLKNSNH